MDEGEELAGGGDSADGLAPPISHAVMMGPDGGGTPLSVHGLDGGPAHQAAALLGDVATMHGGVGLVVAGG